MVAVNHLHTIYYDLVTLSSSFFFVFLLRLILIN